MKKNKAFYMRLVMMMVLVLSMATLGMGCGKKDDTSTDKRNEPTDIPTIKATVSPSPIVAVDRTYTVTYDDATTAEQTALHENYINAMHTQVKPAAEYSQENKLTLKTDGSYQFVKVFKTVGKEDTYKVNIAYTFVGSYTQNGDNVKLEAPTSATSDVDWGPLLSFPTEVGKFTSDDDKNILFYFTTGFFSSVSDYDTMDVIVNDTDMTFNIPENVNRGYAEKEVTVSHGDVNLYGIIATPENYSDKLPTIILSHGMNMTQEKMAWLARKLAKEGIASIRYDFWGGSPNGKSGGTAKDGTLLTEKEDLLAVFDYTKSLDFVNTDRLFLLGESMGGCVTAITAPDIQEGLAGIVLEYPALMIPRDVQQQFSTLADIPAEMPSNSPKVRQYYLDAHDIDIFQYMKTFTKDVVIVHGDKDEAVDIAYSEEALGYYPSAKLVTLPGEGHGFSRNGEYQLFQATMEFISKH